MRKLTAAAVGMVLCFGAVSSQAQLNAEPQRRLQLFNTAVLGASVGDPVKLLEPLLPTDVAATSVTLHVTSNRYDGATVVYPKEIPPHAAAECIQRAFPQCRKESSESGKENVWKDPETGFAIRVNPTEASCEVIFSGLRPPRKATVNDLPGSEKRISLDSR